MTWKTHLIGGAQAGALIAYVHGGSATDTAVIMSTAMLGSVLPDIDHTRSKLAKSDALIGLISHLLSKFTKHRGFTHTIPGAICMSLVFYALGIYRTEKEGLIAFFAALFIFIILHATGDALRWLAGIGSVAVYVSGPEVAELILDHNLSFGINESTAMLCALGIFAGCISHMIYDSANAGGVMWLWPVSRANLKYLTIKTNTSGELIFAGVQIALLTVIASLCFGDVGIYRFVEEIVREVRAMV